MFFFLSKLLKSSKSVVNRFAFWLEPYNGPGFLISTIYFLLDFDPDCSKYNFRLYVEIYLLNSEVQTMIFLYPKSYDWATDFNNLSWVILCLKVGELCSLYVHIYLFLFGCFIKVFFFYMVLSNMHNFNQFSLTHRSDPRCKSSKSEWTWK